MPRDLRDQFTELVVKDLLGLVGDEKEALDKDQRVRERYLVELLASQNIPVDTGAQCKLTYGLRVCLSTGLGLRAAIHQIDDGAVEASTVQGQTDLTSAAGGIPGRAVLRQRRFQIP